MNQTLFRGSRKAAAAAAAFRVSQLSSAWKHSRILAPFAMSFSSLPCFERKTALVQKQGNATSTTSITACPEELILSGLQPKSRNFSLLATVREYQNNNNNDNNNRYDLHDDTLKNKSRFFSTAASSNPPVIVGRHGAYQEEYDLSISDPETFWMKAADKLFWHKKPTCAVKPRDDNPNLFQWFPDGLINTSYNCLDVHVHQNGRGDQVALIYDSPLAGGIQKKYTYSHLLEEVSRCAGGLLDMGVQPGDRVIIYMPMIPEAAIAMLACTRIGATHSVVFGGFAPRELATRISDCDPKVIITASAGIEPGGKIVAYKPIMDEAIQIATASNSDCSSSVENCIVVQRENIAHADLTEGRDVDWNKMMSESSPTTEAIPLPSTHPHYILYTSGTTGLPKGIVRDTGSYAVGLHWSMGAFYDTNPGEVMWAASDIGWVVGHSYIVYAPLLNGCTSILYEGKPVGTPDAGAFWRIIQEHNVRTLFVAPTAFRAIKAADPHAELVQNYDLSCLKNLFLAGEHSDPATLKWCEDALRKYDIKSVDHWWQTELGMPAVGNAVGLGMIEPKYGACTGPVCGSDVQIMSDSGELVPRNTLGNMVIKLPLPPCSLYSLYKNDDRYVEEYLTKFPGYYDTGDSAYIDDEGFIHIMGRTDDVINTAGHRLSTGAMEEILMEHPEVGECAVIGVHDDIKGQIPVGFVKLNAGCTEDHDKIKADLIQMVRNNLGPVAAFKKVAIIKALPKTRSGKILRSTMVEIANGHDYVITPTIENAAVFDTLEKEIADVMAP